MYIIVFKKLKFTVSDYLGTIRFGVITNKHVAEEISLVHSGSVYLHRHVNTSLVSIVYMVVTLRPHMDNGTLS